jgi:hypothetical protein
MPADAFAAKRDEERASNDQSFFTLIYNEQHAPADQWFTAHGWTARPTALVDYLSRLGRPVVFDDPQTAAMLRSTNLVTAVKQ